MAWDASLPIDAQKVRDVCPVTRANFTAIQEADLDAGTKLQYKSLQLTDRTAAGVAVDPTIAANIHYIYSKQDTGAVQEAFMRDAANNVIQLSNDGGIGSDETTVHFNTFTNDAGTTTYDEKNFVGYWAYIDSTGAILAQSAPAGQALTCVHTGTGIYTISFHAAYPQTSTNYGVVVTALASPPNARICHYSNVATTSFQVRTTNQNATYSNTTFTVLILGGRAV